MFIGAFEEEQFRMLLEKLAALLTDVDDE